MNFQNPEVEILLATFNGEKYINELFESLLNQTYKNWKVLIRDDGSTDSTLFIINELEGLYPEKVKVVRDDKGRLGVRQNFHELLKNSRAKYIFFCDQDDIWLNQKIQLSLNKMLRLENTYSTNIPILIHTNMKLINDSKEIISNSFWNDFSIRPERMYFPEALLLRTIITGCTILINKAAKEKILPIPELPIMHDTWISLKMVKFGKIDNIYTPTILYRQHGSNVFGIKQLGFFKSLVPRFKSFLINLFILRKYQRVKRKLGYKINLLKALLFHLYFSFNIYMNKYIKRRSNI